MNQLRGPLTVSNDHRVLSPTERGPWHCSRVLSENWNRWPCEQDAVIVFVLPDGSRAGWCWKHKPEAERHAERLGWMVAA